MRHVSLKSLLILSIFSGLAVITTLEAATTKSRKSTQVAIRASNQKVFSSSKSVDGYSPFKPHKRAKDKMRHKATHGRRNGSSDGYTTLPDYKHSSDGYTTLPERKHSSDGYTALPVNKSSQGGYMALSLPALDG